MRINDMEVIISDYEVERIDDEIVIYNHTTKHILSLNRTASFIWEKIVIELNTTRDTTTNNICNVVIEEYNIPDTEKKYIHEDVDNVINQLFSEGLLCQVK